MPNDLRIRRAGAAEAPAVHRVRIASWKRAYAGLVSPGYLDALRPDAVPPVLTGRLGDPHNPCRTYLAEQGGEPVGMATTGPCRDEDLGPAWGEIQAIYVVPERWSTGVGRALMEHSLDRLSERGLTPVVLWVLRGNARAIAFYERAGFVADGASKLFEGADPALPEIRYRRG